MTKYLLLLLKLKGISLEMLVDICLMKEVSVFPNRRTSLYSPPFVIKNDATLKPLSLIFTCKGLKSQATQLQELQESNTFLDKSALQNVTNSYLWCAVVMFPRNCLLVGNLARHYKNSCLFPGKEIFKGIPQQG